MYRMMTTLLLLSAGFLAAQTAAELDGVLEARTVSGALGARFVLGAADLLPAGLSGLPAQEAAWDAARARGWVRGEPGGALRCRDAAFLVMNAFGFRGGLWYSLFRTPRYAYRELVYRKLLPGRADPDRLLSGEDLLRLLTAALRYAEGLGWKGGDPVPAAFEPPEPVEAEAEAGAAPGGVEVEQGKGLSVGPEGTLPYKGEFEVE
jgi:hypothetical protein